MYRWIGAIFSLFLKNTGMFVGFLIGYFLDNLNIKPVRTSRVLSTGPQATDFEINLLSLCAIGNQSRPYQRPNAVCTTYFVQQLKTTIKRFSNSINLSKSSSINSSHWPACSSSYHHEPMQMHFYFIWRKPWSMDLEVTKLMKFAVIWPSILSFEEYQSDVFQNRTSAYKILKLTEMLR